jgi:hypothetical protein
VSLDTEAPRGLNKITLTRWGQPEARDPPTRLRLERIASAHAWKAPEIAVVRIDGGLV